MHFDGQNVHILQSSVGLLQVLGTCITNPGPCDGLIRSQRFQERVDDLPLPPEMICFWLQHISSGIPVAKPHLSFGISALNTSCLLRYATTLARAADLTH